ncbi:NTP transferase domain-containing protein [Luteolibacter marinus]|uniref:NTP transferase domain-containing protein n=1 Tax=Luteolibacter marinus TaxID=2776705 RepID=UPI001D02913A|nr:NTP transferase domain-containing protein [Luteolibacter marinus]
MITLILIGGKSRRMGRDKAFIERPDGSRQIDHLVKLAQLGGGEIFLSMRDDSPPPVDLPVVVDAEPGGGPLAALAAIHAARPAEPVLVLGCDLFLLDEDTVQHLIDRHEPGTTATCFANRIDGRPEPLCAIYEPSGISMAAGSLSRGEHCARHFLESLGPKVLELPRPAALDNANTPHELAECFAKLTRGVTAKSVTVLYFAKLREARGLDQEHVATLACTPAGLYEELRFRHRLPLEIDSLRAARNGDFCAWDELLADGDEIVFIPPVAGG